MNTTTEIPATPRPAHTPGPWAILPNTPHFVRAMHPAEGMQPVATVYHFNGELAANARLIAAAPELLEALEAVLPDLEHYVATHGPGPDKRLAIARAAIAKARG